MLVICVVECEKKALLRSRRILCKYLPQIGRRTWLGKISLEGSKDLYQALRTKATKQTAITCHRIRGTKHTELLWQIGNKNFFDSMGRYAYKTAKVATIPFPYKPLTRTQIILRTLLQLAALFHDLGKATQGFQQKLKYNSRKADPVRHELLSCLMLRQLFYIGSDDQVWLERLNQPHRVEQMFNECVATNKKYLEYIPSADKTGIIWDSELERKQFPIGFKILWLVLTHHHLPGGNTQFIYQEYFNRSRFAEMKTFIKLAPGIKPWQDKAWQHAVASACARLLKLAPISIELDAIFAYTLFFARPCLVYGDYLASSKRQPYPNGWDQGLIFANTASSRPGDSLQKHLLDAKHWSRYCFMQLHDYERCLPQLKSIPQASIKKLREYLRIRPQLKVNDNFAWQQDAINKILQAQCQDQPFFGIIAAATGTGKTIATLKVMAALSSKVRYTLGLGLRSLTLQTGQVYRQEMQLSVINCAIVVGQSLTSQTTTDFNDTQEQDGITNHSLKYLQDNQVVDGSLTDIENNELLSIVDSKERILLETPLVIATIDHIIRAAELIRSRESLMIMRMITSDLVLDEIDSYNSEDLIALGKLVYLSGLFGRRVLLISATISPVIAQTFYYAYQQGLNQYFVYQQITPKPIYIGLFSHYFKCSQVFALEGNFTISYQHFINALIPYYAQEKPQRRCKILSNRFLQRPNTIDYSTILNGCHHLHTMNHKKIDDIRISIGFVRWNTVRSCQSFAYWLYQQQQPDKFQYAIICYHSRLTLLDRYLIERYLDKNLCRKQLVPPLYSSTEMQHVIEKAQQRRIKDVVIIVSTTSIQETGRDHDYDWAILEPCSTRSIIQSCGRVQRHRPRNFLKQDRFNIYLMQHPVRYIQGKTRIWGFPGIESTPLNGEPHYPVLKTFSLTKHTDLIQRFKDIEIKNYSLDAILDENISNADEVFDISQLQHSVNALLCLTAVRDYQQAPLTVLEYIQLHHLLGNNNTLFSLARFINQDFCKLTNEHAKHTRFRSTNAINNIYYACSIEQKHYSGWFQLYDTSKTLIIDEPPIANFDYSLLHYDLEVAFQQIAQQLSLEEEQAYKVLCQIEIPGWLLTRAVQKPLIYHPLLGLSAGLPH